VLKIYGPNIWDIRGCWKLFDEELCKLCVSKNIAGFIESNIMNILY